MPYGRTASPLSWCITIPSGDPTPSREDVQVTGKLLEAGRLLDIELLDHVILARDGYISLKERRLGFP